MKRLFWSFLLLLAGGIATWFLARRRMDDLYAEISRLREYERKEQELNQHYAKQNESYRKEEAARVAAMTPEQRIDYEMRQAEINSYIKSQIGEDVYNELTARDSNPDDS